MAKKVNPILEFLLNTMTGALETVGELKLVDVLQKFHDKNPVEWEACVRAGHAFIKPLTKLVSATKTPIDDALVQALDEAISQSAADNGLLLD